MSLTLMISVSHLMHKQYNRIVNLYIKYNFALNSSIVHVMLVVDLAGLQRWYNAYMVKLTYLTIDHASIIPYSD